MTKEEKKQWIRNQINSSLKIQDDKYNGVFYLCYNKSYVRALKLSKITGNIVNKENFKGEKLFGVDTNYEDFWIYDKISNYIKENYSNDYYVQKKLIEEVFDEYEEYKGYKHS